MFAPASLEPYNFRSMTPVAGRCVEDGGSDTRSPNLELSTALRIHKARVLEGGGGGASVQLAPRCIAHGPAGSWMNV